MGKSKKGKRSRVAEDVGKTDVDATPDDLQFEDPFEDEILKVEDENAMVDEDGGMKDDDDDASESKRPAVYQPGVDSIGADEALDYDSTAYTTYHKMTVDWPCLSFDFIRDSLGHFRTKFPMSFYMAAGTQAANVKENKVMLLKVSDVHKTKNDNNDSEDISDDEDDLDDDPILEERFFNHPGGVNRIRAMPQSPNILATFSDTGKVHVWDAQHYLRALDKPPPKPLSNHHKPVFTFEGHAQEGFALAWSPVTPGNLLTGDCSKHIYFWKQHEASWAVDKVPFHGHTDSVEDLQWSPNEGTVFASCSVDKTIRIWDTRVRNKSMVAVTAHTSDVNVISWNKKVSHLLASGSDDGIIKVWDLRNFKADSPAANFKWHQAPITSVEWHHTDESILTVASDDDSISCWDMALENDPDAVAEKGSAAWSGEAELPSQLLFVHQGQKSIKELHFHPQCPGLIVSTAMDGFNIFKPSNMH